MPTRIDPRSATGSGTTPTASIYRQFAATTPVVVHFPRDNDVSSNTKTPPKGYAELDELTEEFARLSDQWHAETGHLSSPLQIAMHPAYQRIMTMGKSALPLILRDLEMRGGQWYWALRAIANESPIAGDVAGKVREMKRAWLNWGASHGYLA